MNRYLSKIHININEYICVFMNECKRPPFYFSSKEFRHFIDRLDLCGLVGLQRKFWSQRRSRRPPSHCSLHTTSTYLKYSSNWPWNEWCWSIFCSSTLFWKLLKMSHLNFLTLAFSTNFCPNKTDLSGNTVWPQALGFQKLAKMENFWHF